MRLVTRLRDLASPLLGALAVLVCVAACGSDDGDDGDVAEDAVEDIAEDTTPQDTTYVPPLERITKIEFKINGVKNTFDLDASAIFVAAEQQIKIKASKSLRKLEINLLPITDTAVGQWLDSELSEVGVLICYNDGGTPGELSQCPVGFTHESIGYDVTIAENDPTTGFMSGSFTAVMVDANGDTLQFTDGEFDVKRR